MKLKRKREYLSFVTDKFCAWFLGIVAGVRLNIETIHSGEDGRDRTDQENTQSTVLRPDWSHESRGDDTTRFHRAWVDESTFMGDFKFYQRLRDALREKGLEYNAHYYRSTRDCDARTRHASQKIR